MPTKRTRRPRLPVAASPRWITELIEHRCRPRHDDHAACEAFDRWQNGEAVPGLPDATSPKGRELLAGVRVALR